MVSSAGEVGNHTTTLIRAMKNRVFWAGAADAGPRHGAAEAAAAALNLYIGHITEERREKPKKSAYDLGTFQSLCAPLRAAGSGGGGP
jgi:hypothetical protein